MLGKVLKHDITNFLSRIMNLWLVIISMVVLILALSPFASKLGDFYLVFSSITLFISGTGFVVSTIFVAIIWFSKKMFGDEGYFTHTIPAKISTTILSKIFTYVIFLFLGMALSLISSLAILKYSFPESVMRTINIDVFELTGATKIDFVIQIIVPFFLSFLMFVAMVYLSMALGNAIGKGGKTLNVILIFILLNVINTILMTYVFNISMGDNITIESANMVKGSEFNAFYMDQIIYSLSATILFVLGTIGITHKRLNL